MGSIKDTKNTFNKRLNDFYEVYPILRKINEENSDVIRNNLIFKELIVNEYLKSSEESCSGFIFVIEGTIKIQRINEEGEETNLYNISKGELCHEGLSCFLNNKSLNITGKAVRNSIIATIPFDIINKYCLNDIRFLQEMYKDLYLKFTNVIDNKEERVHESIENRLVKLLIKKDSKIIYATHSELAFEIDSAREVISRKLKELEKRGYIKCMRGKIQIIKDLNELIKNINY